MTPREDYLEPLRGKRVRVVSVSGQSVVGELLGISKYEIKVRQAEGGDVVVLKGAVWTVAEVTR